MIVDHPVDVEDVTRRVEEVVDRIDAKLDELAAVLAEMQGEEGAGDDDGG